MSTKTVYTMRGPSVGKDFDTCHALMTVSPRILSKARVNRIANAMQTTIRTQIEGASEALVSFTHPVSHTTFKVEAVHSPCKEAGPHLGALMTELIPILVQVIGAELTLKP